jgi:8-oxo-dGTP pyrophosphatase MutT (NUDIX family)
VVNEGWVANLEAFERVEVTPTADQRHSAVVLCVVGGCIVITRRASTLRDHAGQYSLPGGRIESGESPVDAALREMEEEIGLRCTNSDVVGVLDDYVTRSGFVITPVVVDGPAEATLEPNPAEVAEVYLVPVDELDHDPRLVEIEESDRPVIQVRMRGGWIHAPTAAVLHQFREVVMHGRHTRVAHYEQPVWAWT